MSRETLGVVARRIQPLYYADPTMAWEQRLAQAYDEASKALISTMPPGTTIDTRQADAVMSSDGDTMDAHADSIEAAMTAGKDLPADSAFQYKGDDLRQSTLGKFSAASQGLGMYLTGYGRQLVVEGQLSQADFDAGAENRLRLFSEIIHASRSGYLSTYMNPEAQAAKAAAGSFSNNATFTVATAGTTTNLSQPSGAQGFGIAPVVFIVVGVVCLFAGAAIGYAVVSRSENIKNRQAAIDACQEAIRTGNPNAAAICHDMGQLVSQLDKQQQEAQPSILDFIIPKSMQQQILPLAAAGLGLALTVAFLPQITANLVKAKHAYSDAQARRLVDYGEDAMEMVANRRRSPGGIWY